MEEQQKNQLAAMAVEIRKDIVSAVAGAKSGHPGGSLSAVELVTYLYFHEMKIDPQNPKDPDRDRFVLSKGHGAPVLYSVLAERGYFSKRELDDLRQCGAMLQGHPDMKGTPGVDMSTGSLGQGLSAAVGMAIAGKYDKKDYRVFTLMGDGEQQEGQIWEAAMAAAHYQLDHLTAFVDNNGLQIDGKNSDVMTIEPLADKWKAFGWYVIEIDGHNFDEIDDAVQQAKQNKGKPTVIIAHTIKGKGVSFMENQVKWHGSAPNAEQTEQALKELEGLK